MIVRSRPNRREGPPDWIDPEADLTGIDQRARARILNQVPFTAVSDFKLGRARVTEGSKVLLGTLPEDLALVREGKVTLWDSPSFEAATDDLLVQVKNLESALNALESDARTIEFLVMDARARLTTLESEKKSIQKAQEWTEDRIAVLLSSAPRESDFR